MVMKQKDMENVAENIAWKHVKIRKRRKKILNRIIDDNDDDGVKRSTKNISIANSFQTENVSMATKNQKIECK